MVLGRRQRRLALILLRNVAWRVLYLPLRCRRTATALEEDKLRVKLHARLVPSEVQGC